MSNIPSDQVMVERWVAGMLTTPPLPCPVCGRNTRARYECQYCKADWTLEQIELRRELRRQFIAQYDAATQDRIRRAGYL